MIDHHAAPPDSPEPATDPAVEPAQDFEVRAYWIVTGQAATEEFVDRLCISAEPGVVSTGPADEGDISHATRDELIAAGVREVTTGLLDANEAMGAALVRIGMALGLPRPSVAEQWGTREILEQVAALRGATGSGGA